jgi:hypothetical protein
LKAYHGHYPIQGAFVAFARSAAWQSDPSTADVPFTLLDMAGPKMAVLDSPKSGGGCKIVDDGSGQGPSLLYCTVPHTRCGNPRGGGVALAGPDMPSDVRREAGNLGEVHGGRCVLGSEN